MSGGDGVGLRACLLEILGVGGVFPTHFGIREAAHMCVLDTTVNWKGICFSVFVSNDLLDWGCVQFLLWGKVDKSCQPVKSNFTFVSHLGVFGLKLRN